jgi:hypothetical protein
MRNSFHGGAYVLDGNGKWRYAHNGQIVPGASTFVNSVGEIVMNAPELLASEMLTTTDLAQLIGVEPASVSRMLTRGQVCVPQVRLGKSPLWARPVVEYWRGNRPGRGVSSRKKAA